MTIQETLLSTRNALLDFVLGIRADRVLNPPNQTSIDGMPDEMYPARDLIRAVNMFKAVAIDESGMHVDYSKLAESSEYLEFREKCSPLLANYDPSALDTPERQLPFWINLYNVIIIDAVISYRVRKSVAAGLGIVKFFRNAAYNVGGQRISPEDIEQGILRGNRGNPYLPGKHFSSKDPRVKWVMKEVDPRIHFALNCASKSCAPIGVYSPDQIDAQLDLATRNFLDHEVRVYPNKNSLEISRIFDWYKVDFGGRSGVIDFLLQKMADGESKSWLRANRNEVKVRYLKYDWGLNI